MTSFGYDAAGNRTSVIDPVGRQSGFVYDDADRMTRQTQGDSYAEDYSYDERGLVSGITGPAAAENGPRLQTSFSRDARGNIVSMADSAGRLHTQQFDRAGRQVGFR